MTRDSLTRSGCTSTNRRTPAIASPGGSGRSMAAADGAAGNGTRRRPAARLFLKGGESSGTSATVPVRSRWRASAERRVGGGAHGRARDRSGPIAPLMVKKPHQTLEIA